MVPRPTVRVRATRAAAVLTAGASALLAFSGAVAPGAAPAAGAQAVRAQAAGAGAPQVVPASVGQTLISGLREPISTSACLTQMKVRCYSPLQYRAAYDLAPLYRAGITGRGRTIVVVDSYGSPTIQRDLNVFDKAFGLPGTTVQVDKWGKVPAWNPKDDNQTGWAGETTLDVEYAHAMAPGAKIVLVETGVNENEGTSGLPQMMDAETYLINHGVGDVISQSFGATENTFPGFGKDGTRSLTALRYAFTDAQRKGVTVLGAAGDAGAASETANGGLYRYPANSWPSSDPLVTSVGGTQLTLDNAGRRTAPDVVWNDGNGAGGGGWSYVFSRPAYQNGVAKVVGTHRGTPDISMSASVDGGAWVYSSFAPGEGWGIVGGTSEATPIFSGIVALADQKAGHRLGLINPALYAMGGHGSAADGIVDVTAGNNAYQGVKGNAAGKGYDLASGWGTVDGTLFVDALAAASR
ncbi:S8 family serine peptidase [Streptacidiphilus sp. PB12-B1b]|uniref:S53 family peptidase n=1 Tax=Streptacidiphilus sp. PB12-B1b TaxID=2705012 RepID=UPI0015F9AD61|nr:S53 family peptidase [Streptacidiphilus sp. PB12-B1b]QMU74558.1 S8 family serine peptidase [Streptacidiphilus sp. PB12-B1b]